MNLIFLLLLLKILMDSCCLAGKNDGGKNKKIRDFINLLDQEIPKYKKDSYNTEGQPEARYVQPQAQQQVDVISTLNPNVASTSTANIASTSTANIASTSTINVASTSTAAPAAHDDSHERYIDELLNDGVSQLPKTCVKKAISTNEQNSNAVASSSKSKEHKNEENISIPKLIFLNTKANSISHMTIAKSIHAHMQKMRINEHANLNTVQSDQAMEDIDQNIGGTDQTNVSMPIDVINESANSLISPLVMPIAHSSAADQAHPPLSEGTTNTNLTSDKSDQTGPETPNSQRKRSRQRKQSSSNIQRTEFLGFASTETEIAVIKQKDQRNDQPRNQRNDQPSDQRNDQPSDQRNDQPRDQRNDQSSDKRNYEFNEQQSYQMLGLYDHDDQNIEPMFVDTNAPQMIDTSDFDQIAQLAGDDLMFPHPMEVYDEPNNAEEQFVMIPVGNSTQQIVAESVGKTKSNSKSGHGKSRQSADQSMRDYASPSIQQKQKAGRQKKPKIDEKMEKAKSKMGVEKAPIKPAKHKSKMTMGRPLMRNKSIMITERPPMKNKSMVISERSMMKNKSIVIPERPTMKNKSILITEKQKTKADKGKSIMIEEEDSATDSSDEIETDGSTDKLADANIYDVVKRIRNNFKYEVSKILAMFVYRQKNELRRLYFIEWKGYEAHSRWVLSEDMNSLELLSSFIEECSMSSALDAFLGAPVMSHVAKLLQKNDEAISLMQSMGKQPEEMAAEKDYFVFAKEATEGQKNKAIETIDEFVEFIKKYSNDE